MSRSESGRQNKLALAITIALQAALATPALGQADLLQEISVTARPIRDSEQAAIDAKRGAHNLKEVIAADTIGRFPDQNLADSLGRVPGLAIERDQGQARFINLRGTPFRYTSIAFDGISVPGAQDARVPRFDSFPSVITSRLEVNKAVLPSMPGESVAGHINVHTFNPFDRRGWTLASDAGLGEQQLGGGAVEKLSLRGSWSNERIGFVLFGSKNSREQITDNREYDLSLAASGELQVNELDFRSYQVEREDSAQGGRLEYRGEGVLQTLFVSSLYSEFLDKEARNQYVFAFSSPQPGAVREDMASTVSRSLQYGLYANSTFTNTLGADFALGQWQLQARLNGSDTELSMNLPIIMSRGAAATARFDLRDRQDPLLYLDSSLAALRYPATMALHYRQALDVDTEQLKLDAERELDWWGRPTVLSLGTLSQRRVGGGFVASGISGAFPDSIDISAFDTGRPWRSNTSNTIGGSYFDNLGLRAAWEASAGPGVVSAAPENRIAIEEEILAAYAMLSTEFTWGSLIVGGRYEWTDYSSAGLALDGPLTVSDDLGHFLPSAHLNIDLAEDLKLRLSASTGISRPNYNEWRATAALNITDRRISGGNPALKPEEAQGLDASLEWYFAPASLLSVGAFQRNIDKVIYADSSPVDAGLYLPSAAGETWTYTGSVNGSDGRLRGLEFNFIGHAQDLLPGLAGGLLEGFGLSANLTLLDTEFRGIDGSSYRLPGTSDTIWNASLFYENHGASLRLNYQYRDEWISPIEDPSEYWGEQQRVDLSASYTLPIDFAGSTVSVYASANNLSNETDDRFAGNGLINQSESYGRHYLMGLRISH